MANSGRFWAVGDQHQGGARFVTQLAEQIEDALAIAGIEVACGFIGQEQSRSMDESAGDGDALHFAAGQFARWGIGPVEHTNSLEQGRNPGSAFGSRHAEQLEGQFYVLARGECGKEVEELEDRAEVAASESGQPIAIQIVEADPVELDAARGGAVHASEEIEQGCFP